MSSFHFTSFRIVFSLFYTMIASKTHNNNNQDLFSVYIVALWFWNASICHENQPENCVCLCCCCSTCDQIEYTISLFWRACERGVRERMRARRKRQSKRIESKILLSKLNKRHETKISGFYSVWWHRWRDVVHLLLHHHHHHLVLSCLSVVCFC